MDFAPPLDYVEPQGVDREAHLTEGNGKKKDVFSGNGGVRID